MLRLQAPLPDDYTLATDEELVDRIAAAKATLGDRLVILGHHYQRDEVIRWADLTGVKTYAKSLDTLGFFAREANDLALIRAAYGHAPADPPTEAPRIGFCRTLWWDEVEPSNQKNLETAARTLRAAGARVRAWEMPESWQALLPAQNRIMTCLLYTSPSPRDTR